MAIGASSSANNAASKKVPASIDALLADQRQKKETESRPKFMTKAEREALAQEKLKDQSAAKADKEKEAAKRREELERAARIEREQQYQAEDRHGSYRGGRSGQYNNRDSRLNYGNGNSSNNNNAPSGPRAMRGNDKDHQRKDDRNYDRRQQQQQLPVASSSASGSNSKSAATNGDVPVFDPAALKARYLGDTSNKKRKVRKQSDKKFVFDWDKGEDTATAEEVDPFYRALREGGHDSSAMGAMRTCPTPNGQALGAYTRSENWPNATIKKEEGDMEEDRPLAGPVAKTKTKAKGIIDERHWSEKTLAEMKDRDWRIFREDFSIAARGGQIPLPIRSWKEAGIPEALVDIVGEIGYAEPSPIQRQSIPIGLNIRDMIGIAETGSGKTAAFVIPMLSYIMKLPPLSDANRHMGPYALILAPTRELAQQIEVETRKFTSRLGFRCVSIVGGRSMEEQALNLRDGAEIIIATPGRLKDCIERSIVVFSQCTYVVMDEADRMISLGFEDVINFILDSLPVSNMKPDSEEAEDAGKMLQILIGGEDGQPLSDVYMYRQTMMFSATMPPACERLARKYLRRPAIVTIGIAGQAVDSVEQRVEFVSGDDKRKARLLEILRNEGFAPPIIVFVNTKKAADVLAKDLNRSGWASTTMHSGKNQEQREAALASLRNGEVDLLVATDLAGRGIDVESVSLVVNFQMANHIEAYVHRIGRTGRAGKTGVAVTFVGNEDAEVLYDLKQEISKSPVSKVPSELARHEAAQSKMSMVMKRKAQEAEDQG